MHEVTLKRCLWITVALAVLAVAMVFLGPKGNIDLPYRYDGPMIALQLSGVEAKEIVNSESVSRFRRVLWLDMLFPFLYGSLYFLLLRVLAGSRKKWERALGVLGMAVAVACVAFDLGENWLTLKAIDGGGIGGLKVVSLAKWAAVGVSAVVLCVLFLPKLPLEHPMKVYMGIASALYLIAAAVLLPGVVSGPRHYWIERGMLPVALASVAQLACVATRERRKEFLRLRFG